MNAVIISKEKTEVKLSFEVGADVLEKGVAHAYNKQKGRIAIPGFRKGKVPRKIIEAQYGEGFFYDEAINHVFPEHYWDAVKELELDIVSKPTLDVEYIDKEKGIKFIVDVTIKPEVTLGDYKGLTTAKIPVEVTDEEIQKEIEEVQQRNARKIDITEGTTEIGDVVKLSYDGSVDGVHFEGGQADEHDLELGSDTFIPGFEEQVAGHTLGEKFDVNVTFPEEYHSPDLAGKNAVFAIEIKKITRKELPEINDEFVEDISDFSTVDEYKNSIKEKLETSKGDIARRDEEEKLLDIVIENATMEVPQVMYDVKIDGMLREFEQNISRQGLNIEIYCQYLGTTVEEMRENFSETAIKSVNARLVLEAIAKAEKIEISDDELNEEIRSYGASYGIDGDKMMEIIRPEDKASIKDDMLVKKAAEVVNDNAKFTEA